MAVQLRPGLLVAWRGPGRLQLGVGEDSLVLDGLDAAEAPLVAALDGSCDVPALIDRAASLGVRADRVHALLGALAEAGALVPATRAHRVPGTAAPAAVLGLARRGGDGWAVLAARRAATVAVVGASLTGLGLARVLAAGGVGTVLVDDDAPVTTADLAEGAYTDGDVGHPRGERAAAHLARTHPGLRTSAAGRVRPDVVVLVATGALEPGRADALVREGVVHLAVVWRGASTAVGPLVRPGSSTCLRCVEAHRADRDPQWPHVLGQLAGPPPGALTRPEEPALAALTAALAAAQVLAHLDGTAAGGPPPPPAIDPPPPPATLDAVLEVTLATGAVASRPWTPHPRCGCTWPGRGWTV